MEQIQKYISRKYCSKYILTYELDITYVNQALRPYEEAATGYVL